MRIDPAVETVNQCIVCQTYVASTDSRFYALLGLTKPYGVVQCTSCGLRWLSPRPTRAGYRDLYTAQNYFDGEQAVEPYSAIATIREDYFRQRIIGLERQLGNRPLSILDVGAATGEFIREAARRGHHAIGLEFSESARTTATKKHGLTLLKTELSSMVGSELYDVIHLNHVFEHLPDPVAALQACRRLLRHDGLLVLEVPQQFDNDLDRLKRWLRIARKPAFNAYSLHHTYFYTPRTLTMLLEQSGFSVLYLATANSFRTPLRPFRVINLALRVFLWLSDRIHQGGNIIEVFAAKRSVQERTIATL